jgi:anhydro-N-acetylmuramic acid kinase
MNKYRVIGLMSGTSLDGLDIAYCHIWEKNKQWFFDIQRTKSISYNEEIRLKLKNALLLTATELLEFNNSYGTWLGMQTKSFIDEFSLEVDFISSHGHTVHHQPEKGFTYQIGAGQHLANASNCKVVCDFRTNDVSLGGQGAPLVPIGDELLFKQYDFCLNLGGISNISFEHQGKRIAYDIGLANMILNYVTQKIGLSYDDGGELARKGIKNQEMLAALNGLAYYKLPYPKSTGYEWFLKEVVPVVETTDDSVENLLHTSIHHICDQIVIQTRKYSLKKESSILVTGGGALNTFLMKTLQEKFENATQISISDNTLIEFKEALVFAFMGVLRVENKVNILSSVTGAKKDSSSGVVFVPS